MLLMLFSMCGDLDVLFRERADGASCDFMMYNGLAVLAHNVNAEFLKNSIENERKTQ